MKYWSASDEGVGHYRRYEKQELIRLLQDEKFQVIRFASYGFPVLNIIAILRNSFFAQLLKKQQSPSKKETRSTRSGLGYTQQKLLHGAMRTAFSSPVVNIWLNLTNLFND